MFACLRKLVDRRIRRAIASVSRRCRLSGITKAKSFFVSSSFPRAQCAESTTYYVAGNTLRANRTAVARCFTCKRLVPVCRRSRTQPCSGHVRSKKLEHLRSGVGPQWRLQVKCPRSFRVRRSLDGLHLFDLVALIAMCRSDQRLCVSGPLLVRCISLRRRFMSGLLRRRSSSRDQVCSGFTDPRVMSSETEASAWLR